MWPKCLTRKVSVASMDREQKRQRRLTRRESVTGREIRACDNFTANVWRANKCSNCFATRDEHFSTTESDASVNPYELNKLRDLLDCGMIQQVEFERRLSVLKGQPTSTAASSSTLSAQPSSSSAATTNVTTKAPIVEDEDEDEVEDLLEAIIVVFFADGTPRYNDMTSYALRTFIDATPRIMVGLLAPNERTITEVLSTLAPSQRHRVLPKLVRQTPYFESWNPTQYKMDIVQYADAFDTIFWFDSDTITFGDMAEFLCKFAASDDKFFMTPDHVNGDAEFCARWTAKIGNLCVIPQACLMGFKSDVTTEFITFWEAIWKHWITPAPFANTPDPNPSFEGSAFCIEQYALGQALAFKEEWSKRVMWFNRKIIAVPKHGNGGPVDSAPVRMTSIAAIPLISLIYASKHPDNLINLQELRSIRTPPKTRQFVSNSILVSEELDFIDRFDNLYHCYNHSYSRVRAWYEQFMVFGTSQKPSS